MKKIFTFFGMDSFQFAGGIFIALFIGVCSIFASEARTEQDKFSAFLKGAIITFILYVIFFKYYN
tara:strand:- start:143 stop:337 length:195 start_codon:yes stop_codon:yes gene_type:complete